MKNNKRVTGIVIPYYKAADHIESVVRKALEHSDSIVIVDDKSPEPLPESVLDNTQVTVLYNLENLGVGGATKKGFSYFQNLEDIKVVIKLDADDQMDTNYIPIMVDAILMENYQFVKGNRFRDFRALKEMPSLRRFGNLGLSFLSKIATGYWDCFDFNNGFLAIANKT